MYMPNIHISLNDDEYKILKEFKQHKNIKWKDLLMSNLEQDSLLNEINEHFEELKKLIPNLRDTTELMRVMYIRFYRLPEDKQKMHTEKLNSISTEYFNEIINMLKEV